MKKFLVALAALFVTSPAFAGLDHWTCSNDQTVMFMVLDTADGSFHLWDDKGQFLAAAKFTEASKTAKGTPFLMAELDSGVFVGIAKSGNTVTLAFMREGEKEKATVFTCN